MFDRLEIQVVPPGPRFAAQLRLWVNGEDVVAEAVGVGGRGPFAADALPAGRVSPLWATSDARRVELGNPSALVVAAVSCPWSCSGLGALCNGRTGMFRARRCRRWSFTLTRASTILS